MVKDHELEIYYKATFNLYGGFYPIVHPYYGSALNCDSVSFNKLGFIKQYDDCLLCNDHDEHRLFATSRKDHLLVSLCESCYKEFNLYIFN